MRREPASCADVASAPVGARPLLRIGELAERTDVSVKALREYERLGLVYSAGRTESNYRLFPPEAIACVQAIKLWRGLGFSLKEMVHLARLVDGGPRNDLDRRLLAVLRRREEELAERIAALEDLRGRIRAFRERHDAALVRGEGVVDRWQAMQQQVREDYCRSRLRARSARSGARGLDSPPRGRPYPDPGGAADALRARTGGGSRTRGTETNDAT